MAEQALRRSADGVKELRVNKRPANLQDGFLNQLRRQRIPITLYLSSGVQLRGQLAGFDSFVVILQSPGKPNQLVYKHSIVSVAPAWTPAPPPPREPPPEQDGQAEAESAEAESAEAEASAPTEPEPDGAEVKEAPPAPES